MIEDIPHTADYSNNISKPHGDHYPCIVCGRTIKTKSHQSIRLFWGNTIVTDAEAQEIIASEGEGGDMGYYPLGNDCLKSHPELKPYIVRPEDK